MMQGVSLDEVDVMFVVKLYFWVTTLVQAQD